MSDDSGKLIRLYPPAGTGNRVALNGLYLEAPLSHPAAAARPFVYTNFVVSIDGRIAIVDSDSGRSKVPPQIANPRDWRLFQELAARADLLITSGRYLRDLAAGQAQDVLPLSPAPEFADLLRWRLRHGLPAQPDVAVLSASLDIPVPAQLRLDGRRVLVFTTSEASASAAQTLQAGGAEVFRGDRPDRVDAGPMIRRLGQLGYRHIYSITGPQVLASLLRADVLDTLFLTTVHRCLGGENVASLVEGPPFERPVNFRLHWLYYDGAAVDDAGQTLARFDRGTDVDGVRSQR